MTKDGISGALGVALTLLGMIQTGGKLGACYNPAVAVTLTVNSMIFLDNPSGYLTHYAPFYFIGPLVGGMLAGFFHLLHKHVLLEEDKEVESRHERAFSREVKQGLIEHHDEDEERKSPSHGHRLINTRSDSHHSHENSQRHSASDKHHSASGHHSASDKHLSHDGDEEESDHH